MINVIFERSSSVLSFLFSCRCFHVVLVIDSSGRFDADDDSAQYKQLLNTRIWIPASVQNIPQYFPPGLSMESYKVCLRAASLSCCYVFSRFSKSYIQHVDAVIQWLFRPGQPPVPCHVLAAGYRRPDDRTGAGYTGATLELVWPNQVPIAVPVSVPVCVPLLLCHSSYGLHRLSGSSSHAKSTSSSAEWEPNSSYGSSETPCCYIPFLGIAGIRYQASRTILFFFFFVEWRKFSLSVLIVAGPPLSDLLQANGGVPLPPGPSLLRAIGSLPPARSVPLLRKVRVLESEKHEPRPQRHIPSSYDDLFFFFCLFSV